MPRPFEKICVSVRVAIFHINNERNLQFLRAQETLILANNVQRALNHSSHDCASLPRVSKMPSHKEYYFLPSSQVAFSKN
jgi:hypothetical protein